jgi:hypothetical protein
VELVNGMLEVCRLNNYEMLTEFVDKLMQEGYCVAQVGFIFTSLRHTVLNYMKFSELV